MPGWVAAGFAEYAGRMPREATIELIQVRPEPRPAKPSPAIISKLVAAEGKRLLACRPAKCSTVALDERGQALTSGGLAQKMQSWMYRGRDVAFLIGGADGLDERVKQEASLLISLSSMTLPHQLVRVLLAEQLYRAVCLVRHHPYHRG